ncbi:MAG: 4-hydroxy-tetrahydrodipicolinate reductase [Acidobacteriota bacterium]
MIRVCLAGATGWIGKPLSEAILASGDLELAVAVARKSAGGTIGGSLSIPVVASIEEALRVPFDVAVEYAGAEGAKARVLSAIEAGRHAVVGSSGLGDEDYAEVAAAARRRGVGVVAVGNFAISAALLRRFAVEAAKHLTAWEVIDTAHDSKADAPSGTAREVAWHLAQAAKPRLAVPVEDTMGVPETRGAVVGGTRVHSIRLPGYTIGVEVLFGSESERLSIKYEGGESAGPYLAGTLLAIRRVPEVRGLVRSLDDFL